MSVPSVQAHGVEPVHSAAPVHAAAASTQSRGQEASRHEEPQDRVTVSEHARKLAATAGAAKGEVELKLDFRKLRELASAEHAPSSPAEPA